MGIRRKPFSGETKRKISKALIGNKNNPMFSKGFFGESNGMWQGGSSFEPYGKDWTERLRRQIRERDNYTCQLCDKENVNIVHHIDYDKKNCLPKNLINLCGGCNGKVNTNREYWMSYFINKLN